MLRKKLVYFNHSKFPVCPEENPFILFLVSKDFVVPRAVTPPTSLHSQFILTNKWKPQQLTIIILEMENKK